MIVLSLQLSGAHIIYCQYRLITIILALQPFVGPSPLFQFLDPIRSR
jgi:hypothetical protein